MQAVAQWEQIRHELPEYWQEVRLSFVPDDEGALPPAGAVLAPLSPGHFGRELRIQVRNAGGVGGAESLRNLLRRLDRKRIWGTLALVDSFAETPERSVAVEAHPSLAEAWDEALAGLPPDWSDLLCELDVSSSDYLPQAALLGAPLNPTRNPDALALRFRVAGSKGYGAPPGLARRCLERMDADGIRGRISILHALSETENVGTQGPVWRIGGRAV
jgi:hypothetical protein